MSGGRATCQSWDSGHEECESGEEEKTVLNKAWYDL